MRHQFLWKLSHSKVPLQIPKGHWTTTVCPFNIFNGKFVVTPSIKKQNWCVSLITSVEIINQNWVQQLIIFKSCEEKWQTQDKSIGSSEERNVGGKNLKKKGYYKLKAIHKEVVALFFTVDHCEKWHWDYLKHEHYKSLLVQ